MNSAPEADIFFTGVPQPVRLIDCGPLMDGFQEIFPTWRPRLEASDPAVQPVITVRRRKGGQYRIEAPWLDEPIKTDTRVCTFASIVVDVIYAWLEANPPSLCMHCAAAEFDGRLVVFPSTNQSGKSSLITRLMADKYVSYGDDLLALTPEGQGMSFGIPPRLRRPLPLSEKKLAEFVRAHAGPADKWNQYIAAKISTIAPFGQARPIGAFVMLTRKAAGSAELVPADAAHSLRNMVYQNLMRRGSAQAVFELSHRLAEEKPCWYLRYSRLDDAVAILRTAFAPGTGRGFTLPDREPYPTLERSRLALAPEGPVPGAERSARSGCSSVVLTRAPSCEAWIRRADVLTRQGQGESFLFRETGDAIFHLNAMGGAVWELLAEPLSEAEAVDLLASVFPETPRAEIAADVAALFEALEKKELILKAN